MPLRLPGKGKQTGAETGDTIYRVSVMGHVQSVSCFELAEGDLHGGGLRLGGKVSWFPAISELT